MMLANERVVRSDAAIREGLGYLEYDENSDWARLQHHRLLTHWKWIAGARTANA